VTPLTCTEASESLLEFVEGALTPEVRHGFEGHLRACGLCSLLFESYKKTSVLCCKMLRRETPAGAVDRLLQSLREKMPQARPT